MALRRRFVDSCTIAPARGGIHTGEMAVSQPPQSRWRPGLLVGSLVGLVLAAAAAGVFLLMRSADACCPSPGVRANLEREAGEFADANGGSVSSSAEAVLTTRQASQDALGGDIVDSDQPVYLVQMEGRFVANAAPRPYGADAPTGTTFWFLYDPAEDVTLDWGLGDQPADLTQLGEVFEIRPTAPS